MFFKQIRGEKSITPPDKGSYRAHAAMPLPCLQWLPAHPWHRKWPCTRMPRKQHRVSAQFPFLHSVFKVREVFALTNQLGTFFGNNKENFKKIFSTTFQGQRKPLSHHGDVIGAETEKARWSKSAGLNHTNLSYAIGTCLQSQNSKCIFGVSSE